MPYKVYAKPTLWGPKSFSRGGFVFPQGAANAITLSDEQMTEEILNEPMLICTEVSDEPVEELPDSSDDAENTVGSDDDEDEDEETVDEEDEVDEDEDENNNVVDQDEADVQHQEDEEEESDAPRPKLKKRK